MIPMKFVNGLIPVIVQDVKSRDVLMLAYATEQAVNLTRITGFAHYFSRSRNKIWKKGEESGHFQRVVRILVDCDEDCLIYDVEQTGAACHKGYTSCFYRSLDGAIISERAFDPDKVYKKRERKQ
jgi:phosphoribosyl-AMP cyclohydrolase